MQNDRLVLPLVQSELGLRYLSLVTFLPPLPCPSLGRRASVQVVGPFRFRGGPHRKSPLGWLLHLSAAVGGHTLAPACSCRPLPCVSILLPRSFSTRLSPLLSRCFFGFTSLSIWNALSRTSSFLAPCSAAWRSCSATEANRAS